MSKESYVSECLNGELRVGDDILHLPVDSHPLMRGTVVAIYPAGSKEAVETTSNAGDCIIVNYHHVYGYNDDRINKIEEYFSDLYGEPKTLDDLGLDEVIDAQDCLLNIEELSEEERNKLDRSEAEAISMAFWIMSRLLNPGLRDKLDAMRDA